METPSAPSPLRSNHKNEKEEVSLNGGRVVLDKSDVAGAGDNEDKFGSSSTEKAINNGGCVDADDDEPRIQNPESRIRNPEPRIQNPESTGGVADDDDFTIPSKRSRREMDHSQQQLQIGSGGVIINDLLCFLSNYSSAMNDDRQLTHLIRTHFNRDDITAAAKTLQTILLTTTSTTHKTHKTDHSNNDTLSSTSEERENHRNRTTPSSSSFHHRCQNPEDDKKEDGNSSLLKQKQKNHKNSDDGSEENITLVMTQQEKCTENPNNDNQKTNPADNNVNNNDDDDDVNNEPTTSNNTNDNNNDSHGGEAGESGQKTDAEIQFLILKSKAIKAHSFPVQFAATNLHRLPLIFSKEAQAAKEIDSFSTEEQKRLEKGDRGDGNTNNNGSRRVVNDELKSNQNGGSGIEGVGAGRLSGGDSLLNVSIGTGDGGGVGLGGIVRSEDRNLLAIILGEVQTLKRAVDELRNNQQLINHHSGNNHHRHHRSSKPPILNSTPIYKTPSDRIRPQDTTHTSDESLTMNSSGTSSSSGQNQHSGLKQLTTPKQPNPSVSTTTTSTVSHNNSVNSNHHEGAQLEDTVQRLRERQTIPGRSSALGPTSLSSALSSGAANLLPSLLSHTMKNNNSHNVHQNNSPLHHSPAATHHAQLQPHQTQTQQQPQPPHPQAHANWAALQQWYTWIALQHQQHQQRAASLLAVSQHQHQQQQQQSSTSASNSNNNNGPLPTFPNNPSTILAAAAAQPSNINHNFRQTKPSLTLAHHLANLPVLGGSATSNNTTNNNISRGMNLSNPLLVSNEPLNLSDSSTNKILSTIVNNNNNNNNDSTINKTTSIFERSSKAHHHFFGHHNNNNNNTWEGKSDLNPTPTALKNERKVQTGIPEQQSYCNTETPGKVAAVMSMKKQHESAAESSAIGGGGGGAGESASGGVGLGSVVKDGGSSSAVGDLSSSTRVAADFLFDEVDEVDDDIDDIRDVDDIDDDDEVDIDEEDHRHDLQNDVGGSASSSSTTIPQQSAMVDNGGDKQRKSRGTGGGGGGGGGGGRVYKPHRCHFQNCNKTFTTKYLLKKHANIHTGLREHQCPFCFKRFNRKDNLLRHKKTHLANALASNRRRHTLVFGVEPQSAAALESLQTSSSSTTPSAALVPPSPSASASSSNIPVPPSMVTAHDPIFSLPSASSSASIQ